MSFFNRHLSNFFACLVLVSLQPINTAQASTNVCIDKDTEIFLGNGIRTTEKVANRNLDLVRDALKVNVGPTRFEKIDFAVAYNQTNGTLADLFEAYIQDLNTTSSGFWRVLAELAPVPDSFKNKFLEISATADRNAFVTSADLQTHVGYYKNSILEGKRVILLAASQGAFFANQAYFQLSNDEQDSFGIVAAGTFDNFVAGGGPYTNLLEDLPIQAYSALKPPQDRPLAANLTNLSVSNLLNPDPLGHSFGGAYFVEGSTSQSKIILDIQDQMDALPQPESEAKQGIITVTLTWGAEPDVDLHAFEPNGTHVYYRNLRGQSGFLDVDDVTGFGPEHYYVNCDSLEAGTYRIGVNYYAGSTPEIANVLIKAGYDVLTEQSINLPEALGSSGNQTPQMIGDIEVIGNNSDGYRFGFRRIL